MRSGDKRDEERYKKKWLQLFPEARLNALTPAALEQARAQLVVGRSIGTVNHYFKFLRRVLNKEVRDGQLTGNPVSRIKLFKEPAGKNALSVGRGGSSAVSEGWRALFVLGAAGDLDRTPAAGTI